VSFPRYPAYKDSGVDWIGEVPAHWLVQRLKHSLVDIRNGVWGDEARGDSDDIICVRVADFDRVDLRVRLENSTIRSVPERERSSRALSRGDLLIEKSGGGETQPVGCVVLYDAAEPAVCSNFVARVRLKPDCVPSFWCYVHSAAFGARVNTKSIKQTSGIQNLDSGAYFDELATFPPRDEQRAIAAFLDRETAKIDALVAEQRLLIDLLQEKRQAVISHAVTKGLNPDAPMRNSGEQWLGEVPAHWKVGKVGFYMRILSGFAFPSSGFSEFPTDTRLLRGVNVGVSRIRWDETVYWPRAEGDGLDDYVLKAGDLVIGMDRPLISEGMRVATISPEDEPCLLLQRVARLEPHPTMNAHFLKLLMASPMFIAHFTPDTTGVSVPHISPDQIKSFVAPVPPRQEQDEIVDHVHELGGQYDALIQTASEKIDLLQERRAALITAAVTGQIDVRGLAVAEAA